MSRLVLKVKQLQRIISNISQIKIKIQDNTRKRNTNQCNVENLWTEGMTFFIKQYHSDRAHFINIQ